MHESKRRRESRSDVLGDVLSERFREYTLVYSLQTVEKLLRGSCQRSRSPSDYLRIDRLCRSSGAFSATPKTLPAVSGEKDRCRRAFLTSFREYTLVYSLRLSKNPWEASEGRSPPILIVALAQKKTTSRAGEREKLKIQEAPPLL